MSQKIKVQDGVISYVTTDPSETVDMTVVGQVTVTNEIIVGSVNSPIDGVISTGDGTLAQRAKLDITTGAYGSLNIFQSPGADSSLNINNAQWPTGSVPTSEGMYLGFVDVNKMEYLAHNYAYNPNDALTAWELNNLYNNDITPVYRRIKTGQWVVGLNVLYYYLGNSQWRKISAPPVL